LSFNETFDESKYYSDSSKEWSNYEEREQRKNRTFATLEKLDVKWNSNMDNTYSRNQYASDMLKDYGMFTQKCSLASFSMGGGKLGVYKILEPVDEIFIQRYFPEEDWGGDLYKAHWSYKHPANYHADSTYGIVNKSNTEFYQFDLQTNEESSDYADLKNLLEVINQEDVTRQDLESVIDMDYFIRFCALNYMIGNQDDMRNNYNNHYVYFRASDGKAVIIPIDLEICLGDTYAWNPSGNGCTDVSPYSDISVGTGLAQENPLINLTVTENGFYKDEYTAYLLEISESKWMTVENYQNYYEIARKNYSDEIISSYRYCSTWGCNLEFSMNGGEEYNGNMAVGEFMSRIKQTVYEYAGE
jgi:spore coat protein CotH